VELVVLDRALEALGLVADLDEHAVVREAGLRLGPAVEVAVRRQALVDLAGDEDVVLHAGGLGAEPLAQRLALLSLARAAAGDGGRDR
jgi:hypothetical protein